MGEGERENVLGNQAEVLKCNLPTFIYAQRWALRISEVWEFFMLPVGVGSASFERYAGRPFSGARHNPVHCSSALRNLVDVPLAIDEGKVVQSTNRLSPDFREEDFVLWEVRFFYRMAGPWKNLSGVIAEPSTLKELEPVEGIDYGRARSQSGKFYVCPRPLV